MQCPCDLLTGLTSLTSLSLHGCEMITSNSILVIGALINLQHLDLELCNKASGLQHMAGIESFQPHSASLQWLATHVCHL